jgi:hypothetical protein
MTQQLPSSMVAQTLHIPAGLGIDQATRAEHVQPGAANLMQVNVRIADRQALQKRNGFTALSSAWAGWTAEFFTARPDGIKMFAHGKQTCVIDDDGNLDTHLWSKSTNALQTRIPRLSTETIFAAHCGDPLSIGDADYVDVTICNGFYILCSWEYNGTTRYPILHVLDQTTKALIRTVRGGGGTATYGSPLRLVSVGNKAYIAHSYSGTNIYITPLDCTSMATLELSLSQWASGIGSTTVATDWLATGFDMCATATRVYVFYANNSGGATAGTVNGYTASTMALVVSGTIATTAAVESCSIDGSDSDTIWLAWSRTGSLDVFVHGRQASNFINITASTTAILTGSSGVAYGVSIRRTGSTGGYVIAGTKHGTVTTWPVTLSRGFYVNAGATTAGGQMLFNVGYAPSSQPFVVGNYVYANCGFYADALRRSPSVCVFKIGELGTTPIGALDFFNTALPCASPMRGNSTVQFGFHGVFPCHTPSIDTYGVAYTMPVALNAAEGTLCIIEARTDRTEWLYHRAEHNGVSYFSGAQVYCYDGVRAFEAGFVCPSAVTAAVAAGAGLEIGTYIYTAVHQWCDAEGNVHWSEPAVVQTLTTTSGNQRGTIRVMGCAATAKVHRHFSSNKQYGREIRTLLFRTKVGGGPFYLHSTYVNDTTAGGGNVWSLTDSTSDTTLGSGRKLYTQPGLPGAAQSRRCPPSAKHIGTYGDMLIVIADDGRTIWPSGQRVVGEGAWWGDAFQIPGAADLVGTKEMDGTLYVFSRSAIYALTGDAPSDNGLGGGLNPPRLVCASSGCIDARSLVRTDAGIFFRSDKGIEVLGRDGSVSFIGEQVWREVDACPLTTSAVYDARNNVVIFTLAKQQTGGIVSPAPIAGVSYSRRLVFDLSSGVWCSVDKVYGVTALADVTAQSADVVWNDTLGEYVYAWQEGTYYGTVHVENDGYTDTGTTKIVSEWTPAWLKLEAQADHQFYQGILRIDRDGTAGLEADVYYDWSDTLGETKVWTAAEITSYPLQVELRPKASQQAVKLTFRDTFAGAGDALGGLNFVGLSFDIGLFKGPQQGVPRIATAARK